jgi:23S rRNA pseudouridine1911/1915/1917 synthase
MHELPAARERRRPQPEPVEVSVVYEDEAIVALDKPPGMVVHPTYKNTSGTLLNGVLWRYRDQPDVQPGILTRLDKDTSGLVVVALRPDLHARMQRERMRKEYIAVVHGVPDPARGVVTLPLARSPEDRRRVVVTGSGAPCETRYELAERLRGMSVVRCELLTGRTHQIRVHLASLGCPVVGDVVYGPATADPEDGNSTGAHEEEVIARQALHAWRDSILHPVTRERLELEAPLPADIATLISRRS